MRVVRTQHTYEAYQWHDQTELDTVIQPYASPDSFSVCAKCRTLLKDHGWIPQDESGLLVCPGSYIVKYSNTDHSVHSHRDFKRLFTVIDASLPLLAVEFQERVALFYEQCFMNLFPELLDDRNYKRGYFIEQALGLVYSLGMSQYEVMFSLEYIFSRPKEQPPLKIGDVCIGLANLANHYNLTVSGLSEERLTTYMKTMDKIRQKHALRDRLGLSHFKKSTWNPIDTLPENIYAWAYCKELLDSDSHATNGGMVVCYKTDPDRIVDTDDNEVQWPFTHWQYLPEPYTPED